MPSKKQYKLVGCNECKARFKSVFKKLGQDDIDIIVYEKSCNYYKKGEIIYSEGNRINGIYCVNSGVIKLYKTGSDFREQIIRFAQEGDIIGYRSILSREPACTTAKAIEDSIVCFIPSTLIFEMVKEKPGFSFELLQLSCKELGEANKFILDIAQKTVRERTAEVLLLLKNTFGLDEENFIKVNLTREEIAGIVGTATESVIRTLSEFKNDGLIGLKGKKIKIIDAQKLVKIANIY